MHADQAQERLWLERVRGRVVAVLLLHPAELAEFVVGLLAVTIGVSLQVHGAALGLASEAFWGGVALAAFGVPQMISAIHGSLMMRHASNMLGCYASLANLIRTTRDEVPFAMAFYLVLFVLCLFFWGRTHLARLEAASRGRKLGE